MKMAWLMVLIVALLAAFVVVDTWPSPRRTGLWWESPAERERKHREQVELAGRIGGFCGKWFVRIACVIMFAYMIFLRGHG